MLRHPSILVTVVFVFWLQASVAIAAPSPRMLVEISDLSGVAISPDGHSVTFREERASVERNTYDSWWYVQVLDDVTAARRVVDGGIPLRDSAGGSLVEAPIWSPDSQRIFYRA